MDTDGLYVSPPANIIDRVMADFLPSLRIVLLNYREDGITPYVIIWKDGLSEMKV